MGISQISELLRGHARHVMRSLGTGHREAVYHRALITSLNREGVPHRSEVPCPIMFMGECVGMGRADLVMGDIVVEIKANKLPPEETSPQLQKYLESLRKAERREFRGLILNFNQKKGYVDVWEEACLRAAPARMRVAQDSSLLFRQSVMRSKRVYGANEDAEDSRELPAMFKRRRDALEALRRGGGEGGEGGEQ